MGSRLSSHSTGLARSMPGKETFSPIMSFASQRLLMSCPCPSASAGPSARASAQLPSLPSQACILGCRAASPCSTALASVRQSHMLQKPIL